MTEANNNANSSNSEYSFEFLKPEEREKKEEIAATANNSSIENSNSSNSQATEKLISTSSNSTEKEVERSSNQKMNWQKVAHKLREYNRKLLKNVFRLEQELADVENKFKKYVEKSRSSDVLVAQQEEEIRKYQERGETFDRELATYQATIDAKEATIANLFQQYELSQQQTAQLERDCTLLQENYNHQNYELIAKEKEVKQLQDKLVQQQRLTLQYQTELKREREQVNASASTVIPAKEPAIQNRQNCSSQRKIEPWSTYTIPNNKISLPKTQPQPIPIRKTASSQTVKTAAKIATWSASQGKERQRSQTNNNSNIQSKSSIKAKPKSLAAVDLPTFPRPM